MAEYIKFINGSTVKAENTKLTNGMINLKMYISAIDLKMTTAVSMKPFKLHL